MYYQAIKEICQSGPVTVRVDGECMGENLPHGCVATVVRKSFYWPGDVLVLGRGDDRLVSHRLLGYFPGTNGWNILTKADVERHPDAPVPLPRIIGKVTRIDGEAYEIALSERLRSIRQFAFGLISYIRSRILRSR